MSGNFSPSFSVFDQMYRCYHSTAAAVSLTVFSVLNIIFVLPLCILVLYMGLQQLRQQNPNTPMNHCDVLTYNMVLIDLLQVIGSVLSCYSVYADVSPLIAAGIYMLSFYLSGQMMFFPFTCVDCYMAIVFPIMYLNLKKPKFVKARNITIGFIWLGSIFCLSLVRFVEYSEMINFLSFLTALLLLFIVFSCLSVLYVLHRPGPGEGGKRQVDQSKMKAFNIMIAILTVMIFRFMGAAVYSFSYVSADMKDHIRCAVWLSLVCNGLPCSLLMPILFLQRTGKIPICKNK